jgi:hypothetical protein
MNDCGQIRDMHRRRECVQASAQKSTSADGPAHQDTPRITAVDKPVATVTRTPGRSPTFKDSGRPPVSKNAADAPTTAVAVSRPLVKGEAFVERLHQQHAGATSALLQLGEPLLGLSTAAGGPRFESSHLGGKATDDNRTWLDDHPLQPVAVEPTSGVDRRAPRHRFALCLWGIACVASEASLMLHLLPSAIFQSAASHIDHILLPAERFGWETSVFAHSWSGHGSLLALAVDRAYGRRLKRSQHDRLGKFTADRVTSLVISVCASLSLAATHAAAEGAAFDLMMNARFDLFAHRDFDLRVVDPRAFTTAVWCVFVVGPPATGGDSSTEVDPSCGSLHVVSPAQAVSDWWFTGSQTLLEWFWGSLRLQRLAHLSYNGTSHMQRISMPEACMKSRKASREGFDRCEKVHPVIEKVCSSGPNVTHTQRQSLAMPIDVCSVLLIVSRSQHAEELGLKQRGLYRTVNIVEGLHFTLYRDRMRALNTSAGQLETPFFCDGKQQVCPHASQNATPPSVLHAEAAWSAQEKNFSAQAGDLPMRTEVQDARAWRRRH